jgi:hypothetical protein
VATTDIINTASDPVFHTRVAFIALKVAQNVATESDTTPNHANRLAYCARIFSGQDKSILLANHVAAANPTIAATLEEGDPNAVPDADIEFALGSIWDARANSFAAVP